MSKSIPTTTNEACEHYGSQAYYCTCKDYTSRKGSYVDPFDGDKVCKHMFAMRNEFNPRRTAKPKSVYTDAQRIWMSNCNPVLPGCKSELAARMAR